MSNIMTNDVTARMLQLPADIIIRILWRCDLDTLAFKLLPAFATWLHYGIRVWDPHVKSDCRHLSQGPACLDMRLVLACYELCDMTDAKYQNNNKSNNLTRNVSMYHMYYTILPNIRDIIVNIYEDEDMKNTYYLIKEYRDIYELYNDSLYSNSDYENMISESDDEITNAWPSTLAWHCICNSLLNLLSPKQKKACNYMYINKYLPYRFIVILAQLLNKCIYSTAYRNQFTPNVDAHILSMVYDMLEAMQDTSMRLEGTLAHNMNPYMNKTVLDRYSTENNLRESIWAYV